ncbi:NDP-hexose 2,3-dehydratase family protein [Streptomyces sp. NPDC005393]|uniref:NDP-hexose 2,3-dehydratase family protein n=1 Tax=Streptomyces sp. NPDC005393 TaxID=3157041 RepID=UPI0033A63861
MVWRGEVVQDYVDLLACVWSDGLPAEALLSWLDVRRRANRLAVERVPFRELSGWEFDDGTGNLRHTSGHFFSIEGLRVRTDHCWFGSWTQPIIVQPEIGILGLLVKRFDGVLHVLVQAKNEPGNIRGLQLSPTVQATRSNYPPPGGAAGFSRTSSNPSRAPGSCTSGTGTWWSRPWTTCPSTTTSTGSVSAGCGGCC